MIYDQQSIWVYSYHVVIGRMETGRYVAIMDNPIVVLTGDSMEQLESELKDVALLLMGQA